ncbi:hypothetical protein KTJ87_16455 [Rhodobacteraceae bacterium ASV31]|nr:hypothetical protein [Anianabacter salinae]
MQVQLKSPWDGNRVPSGQQCSAHGGNGSTPPMRVSGIPDAAVMLVFEYNDKSYQPLSRNGGHGIVGVGVRPGVADIPALPGMTDQMPRGARIVKAARSTGSLATSGYLPPCSGGRNNQYTVDVKAINAQGKVIETLANVSIGRY